MSVPSVHPKINVYTIVWNEEWMLPRFLAHYEKIADRIFVIDDHSTDLTPEIAKAHPMVTYLEYEHEGWNERQVSDTFNTLSKKYPSDWAVAVDCDEFIFGLEGLSQEPSGVLKTTGYMMIGKTGKLEDCKKIRMRSFDKPVVFDPKLDVGFGDGRHTSNPPGRSSGLELWHYKYPSREHYLERNLATYPRIMDERATKYRIKRGLDWYDKHI